MTSKEKWLKKTNLWSHLVTKQNFYAMIAFQKVENEIWIGLNSKLFSKSLLISRDSLSLPQSIHWMSILYTKLDSTSGSQDTQVFTGG